METLLTMSEQYSQHEYAQNKILKRSENTMVTYKRYHNQIAKMIDSIGDFKISRYDLNKNIKHELKYVHYADAVKKYLLGFSNKSAVNYMRYIKSVLKYADESGIKCSYKHFNMVELDNPVKTIPTNIYKKLNKLALDEAKDNDGALLYLLLSITGARIKDIEGITNDNFTTSSIHYCPSKTNSACITVPISRTVSRLLTKKTEENKKDSLMSKEQSKKVFPRHDRNSLYYVFKKWINSLNIKGEVVKDKVSADGTRSHEVIDIKDFIRPHKRSTYEIESGVPEDETVTNPRYKTSVVANRRLYVGNVMATYPDGVEEVLGDTMIKSVVDNYDVLPLQNAIDVAIKDGDEIVRLMEYGDRILQFKKNTLYVINISQDREYLEATYRNKGIPVKSAAVETDYGIVWANQHSCYLYNGRTIVDLLVDRQGKRKIDPAVWTGVIKTTIDSPVNLGYSATGKVLVVDPDASDVTVKNAYVYDFKTGSWSIQPDSLTVNSSDTRSNFVKRWDGELMYGSAGRFHLWKDDLHKGDEAEFITKDYILGAPNKTVKLYNVYITYKSTEAISSCLSRLRYAIDGTGNFSAFNNCTVGGSTVTSLPITWTNLKAGGTDVLTNGTTTGAAANEVIVLDYTTELVANDFISIAGDNNEYMKVLETEDTDSIKVQRGHPIGGVLDATSNDSQVTVLKWKQAKFGITSTVDSETRNGVTCNSVQLRFNPNVSAGLMVQSIIFEYRPLYKESA